VNAFHVRRQVASSGAMFDLRRGEIDGGTSVREQQAQREVDDRDGNGNPPVREAPILVHEGRKKFMSTFPRTLIGRKCVSPSGNLAP
jgi:hypothetical protein